MEAEAVDGTAKRARSSGTSRPFIHGETLLSANAATGTPNMTISADSLGRKPRMGNSSGPFLPCALHQLPGEKIAP